MTVDEQAETVAFLMQHGDEPVAMVRTHISLVFLAARAFKLKRAVRFPYLDFSTAALRLAACKVELALNRRTAPTLYLGVRRITREADGRLMFDGPGTLVDAVVEMRRFDEDGLFDRMAQRGALNAGLMTELAHSLAGFHAAADVSRHHGGTDGIAAVLATNNRSLRATGLVPAGTADVLGQAFRLALAGHTALLDARRAAGKVRRCHGDLILRNICLWHGAPTLFDCIEFDEAIATIDVLYDLAFLLMDLWRRDLSDLANLVLNRYLDEQDETGGLALLPFFMAVRAVIRAHVTAAQAKGLPPAEAGLLIQDARAYLDMVLPLLATRPAALFAVGGFSGSGKSTLAAAIAPHLGPPPGARIVGSDRVRKRLHGVAAGTRLPDQAYSPEVSEMVYAAIREQAAATLRAGWTVVVDAVFNRASERAAIEGLATAQVPFAGMWLDAPTPTMLSRIAGRANDPSDADAAVLERQLARGCGDIGWHRFDAGDQAGSTRDAVLSRLDSHPLTSRKPTMLENSLYARDLLTADVVTAPPGMPVTSLARLLADRGISSTPVVDDHGTLLGIVTEADLLRRLVGTEHTLLSWLRSLVASADQQATQYARTHGLAVRDVMTQDLVTVGPDATAEQCARLMEQRHVKRLPVVEDGRLVGIVSRADLLRAVLEAPPRIATKTEPRDDRIRSALRSEMLDQPWATTLYATTDVEDGVVTLNGTIHSDAMRRGLRVLAERIAEVERVDDRLVVAPQLFPHGLA